MYITDILSQDETKDILRDVLVDLMSIFEKTEVDAEYFNDISRKDIREAILLIMCVLNKMKF